VTKYNNSGET